MYKFADAQQTSTVKLAAFFQKLKKTVRALRVNGDCLKQEKFLFDHGKIVNIYIVYDTNKNFSSSNYPTLENCLFGAVKLTKHIDFDLYKYSRYGIGLDRKGFFSIGDEFSTSVIIFGVDMSSFSHTDDKKKDVLTLGKGSTQALEHTLPAEKLYSINFTKHNTKFCLCLHYNGGNSYLFVSAVDIF